MALWRSTENSEGFVEVIELDPSSSLVSMRLLSTARQNAEL